MRYLPHRSELGRSCKRAIRASARAINALGFVLVVAAAAGCSTVTPYQPAVQQGGRAETIAVDPANASRIFVTSETGGLFATRDGGTHWLHMDSLPSYLVKGVAVAPGHPDIVVVAAQADWRVGSGPVWRSINGGRNWTQPAGSTPPTGPGCGPRVSGYSVAF